MSVEQKRSAIPQHIQKTSCV
nr:unnamed protein product [Callosobruchus analis]